MNEPLLHERTNHSLKTLMSRQPHAILLHGLPGMDLAEVAEWLAANVAGKTAYITQLHPEKTGISIDQIRSLYTATRAKQQNNCVIILHQTELMSAAAQTAFLKLLEEPTPQTTFVLLSHTPEILLPTIRSRTQHVEVLPLNETQTSSLLAELGITDVKLAQQLRFVADGLTGELRRLIQDQTYRQSQFERAAMAKQLLQGSLFERLSVASRLSGDREVAQRTLILVVRILATQLARQPDNLQLVAKLDATLVTISRLRNNGSLKAQMLRFSLAT